MNNEWIELNLPYNLFDPTQNKKSFTGLDLNKPGTLIEIEVNNSTYQYLIGHLNRYGAEESREDSIDSAIVRRYKIIWSE